MVAAQSELLGDTPCVHCGYSLRTLARDGKCPECGQPVADSLCTWDEARIIAKEQRILARMDTYRRNRNGAVWLAGVSAIGVAFILMVVSILPSMGSSPGIMAVLFGGFYGAAFWVAVAFANRFRYEHAQSIERFRLHEHLRENQGQAAKALKSDASQQSNNG